MKVTIRKATVDDLKSILDIVNHEITQTTVIYDYEARTLSQQKEWFDDKMTQGFPVIVAVKKERVVGFGTFGYFRMKAAYQKTVEHSIYLAEDMRGFGIGQILMEALLKEAITDRYHTMIGVIDATNIGSIEFHERFGFSVVGKFKEVGYKFDQWLDILFMQKILD